MRRPPRAINNRLKTQSSENPGKGRKRGKLQADQGGATRPLLGYPHGGKVLRIPHPGPRPLKTKSRYNFRVLVPGAGLGRLAYDVAKLGRFLSLLFHFRDRFPVRLFVSGKRVFTLHAAHLILYS